ncbi:hypothetical protein [Noviherbaspirillum autotrophicum]|uniref:Uncharacterized protein n=1 Tax=Noviherbaspirillum autotrophicum TaxID=709839 RepID=A0A0C1Y3X0_9BURK|nr:hypothetical protein [Noviherbaspirillum autotrophicum]KIF81813.1 hypothetical protein TSA66_15035 [Noviherbaspirillum autotrophicum]
MTIRREDLAAAAAVGLLHYKQVEPLLVFLLQRDLREKREEMLAQMRPAPFQRLNRWLSYLAGALALATAILFVVLLADRGHLAGDIDLLLFTFPYGLGLLVLVLSVRRRGIGARLRMPAALVVASVPLAVLALHHVGV